MYHSLKYCFTAQSGFLVPTLSLPRMIISEGGKKKNSDGNVMFWTNISDNLPPIMVCMKCHHALVKWRMRAVGEGGDCKWQGGKHCNYVLHVLLVLFHIILFVLPWWVAHLTVVWFGNVIYVICCCLCHSGRSAQENITVLLCVNGEGSSRQVSTVVAKSLQPLLKT